jgi:hypothetical protein
MEVSKVRLYENLIDAIQRSQYSNAIPLPAILDNQLEKLNEKYGYNKKFEDDDGNLKQIENKPKFDDEDYEACKKNLDSEDNKGKLKNKLKELQKRRAKTAKK